jgi:phage gp45-like
MIDQLRRLLAPLERKINSIISRGVVTNVDDTKKWQVIQAKTRGDLLIDGIEHPQPYGVSANPKVGAECILVSTGSGIPFAIVVDDRRYRPVDTEEGCISLYTHEGVLVKCKVGQIVELGPSPTDFVALATPTDSRLSAIEDKLNSLIGKYNAHFHPHPQGPTSATASVDTVLVAGSSTAATKVKAI